MKTILVINKIHNLATYIQYTTSFKITIISAATTQNKHT